MKIPIRRREKRETAHMNLGGMYALGFIFCVFIAALINVQASVQYSIRDEQLSLQPREKLIKLKAESQEKLYGAKADTLLVIEEGDDVSIKAQSLIEPVLEQMKEPFDICDAGEFEAKGPGDHEKVILAVSRYQKMGTGLSRLKEWVKAGGSLMVLYPPEKNGSFESMYDIFGIKDSGNNAYVSGIHFTGDLMIGGLLRDYEIEDAYESSRAVSLTDDCVVYLESKDDYPIPLIWKKKVGFGTVVFDNFGIMEKAYRGLHCAVYSLMGDYCIYPVINGATFYIDDFPSPVPEGDSQYITRDYNMSVGDFYSQIWWNDVYDMGQKYGIHYTGLTIENYNNQVMGQFKRNTETSRFLLFGNMLLRSGGEIGIHGYNHMPLVLENFDYQNMYDGYIQWPNASSMKYAVNEVFNFTKDLFPEENLQVYVPPSNVLSQEGREVLGTTSIRSIASVYLPADLAYAQEFEVSKEDGIINTPRIISGYMIDDYMSLAALSELNFHLVSTHFQHPDDVLDEDRGAAIGWETLKGGLYTYMDWLYKSFPGIRNLTGSELAAAVQRYDLTGVDRKYDGNRLVLTLDDFDTESWLLLRVNDGKKIRSISGGNRKAVATDLYLIQATGDEVTIDLE